MDIFRSTTHLLLIVIYVCLLQCSEMASQPSEAARPKLIVFDLDTTLWPFWVDTHVLPPFRKRNGDIFDRRGKKVVPYPEVLEVMEWLHSEGFLMAAASRTTETRGARQLIALFGWDKYLKFMEIYPGIKTAHFAQIQKQSNIPLSEMLFFDDERKNIRDLTQLGVVSVLVCKLTGITMQVVKDGLAEFAARRHEGHLHDKKRQNAIENTVCKTKNRRK